MLPEQQQRILGYFIEEARDHVNTIEQGLLNLEGTLNDPEMISEVFRAAHSIKGGAAMLGLTSIQHTSHRLEDSFKVLKDHPVKVDQKLESLFLGVSDTLKVLLEHLSGPFGLSEDAANVLMSETEPVFQWLNEHLELLVEQGNRGVASNPDATQLHTASVENVSTLTELFLRRDIPGLAEDTHQESTEIPFSVAPQEARDTRRLANAARSPVTAKENNNWGEFQAQVLQTLREMLQLFKQTTTTSTRQKLQQCCYQLVRLGETWNLSKWCGLCQAAASAIGNPENTYLTLAKIVITEIKQAQELVLQGREAEIAISHQLEALLSFAEIELLEITPNLFDEQFAALTELSTSPELIVSVNTQEIEKTKQLVPQGRIINLSEELNLDENSSDRTALSHASLQLQETLVNPATPTSFTPTVHDEVHPISNNLDHNGPEVGISELNTLADLFAGETPELDETWHQEETLDIVATDNFGIDFSSSDTEDADSDLSDLLSFDDDTSNDLDAATTATTEDLSLLFGDNFLEKENSEPQNQQINELLPTGEVTQPETEAIANVELSPNQQNSFDNLFLVTENKNWVEEIIPSDYIELPQQTGLSLDSLFADMEEQTLLPTTESEIGDLFATSPAIAPEFSQSEDDLSNFWNQETLEEQLGEFDSLVEQNVERALEESLFTAAGDDIFGDSQQPILSPIASFDIEEDFDLNFQPQEHLDLIFSSDSEDDLFEELAPSNSIISSAINDDVQPSTPETSLFAPQPEEEIHRRSQQPEALDFVPEFTNQPPEIFAVDPFGSFDENTDEDSQLLFEDVAINDSTYIQLDSTDELSATENTLDISSQETSVLPQTNAELLDIEENNNLETAFDFTDNTVVESTELDFVNDLLFTETTLLEAANQEELAENAATIDSQAINEFTQTVIQEDVAIDLWDLGETSESVTVSEEENPIIAQTEELATRETIEVATPEDEFADLAALLGEEVVPIPKAASIPEVDFAALEELLGADNDEAASISSTRQPFNTQPALAKNAIPSPAIEDEFGDLEKLLAEADQTISHAPLVKLNTSKLPRPSTRRAARFEETMKVPVKQLDDMSNLVGELVVNRNTLEQDNERLRQSLDNLLIQVQQLSDVGARMQELYERSLLEASLLAGRKKKDSGFQLPDFNADRGFSELEMDRFTPFHTLSQQMIERIVRIRESASDIDFVTEETERVARQFRQVTTQLQEGLTRARMVPFAQTIDRWRRGVRDNAIKCGKQVELVIEGGDTLIDKMILDHLTDPLTHMLNNAIAHGIETPEERQAAGKPPVGIITIRAFHQGNQTIISVGDDGAGIDSVKVKAKAVKIGMITLAEAKTMSRLEVYDLLFQSGFTIKDQADEISGRGVGMDVVRSEISEIRGTVNTDSAVGKGTTFTIRLPLTLSICKALCCVSDRARIAFPMDGVEDTLDIPVKNIQHDANGQSFISWRDTILPFRPLRELLTFNRQISRGNVYGGTRDDDMVSVVVVRSANTMIALQIDLVLSEQEIVIKQFEGPAPKPIGVAGATVLGDGRIMPIADVLEIIDIFQGRISTQIGGDSWQQKATPPDISPAKIDPTVLIVDDSITVRELLSLTFNKAGYRVEQARDGQEAWDKLRSGLPCDIVFCDIEMPRCDGLELLSRIQKDPNLNHLPIAMLTSRGADKHRQIAAQLGASGYFTKPYLEEALLEAAARMLKGEKLLTSTN